MQIDPRPRGVTSPDPVQGPRLSRRRLLRVGLGAGLLAAGTPLLPGCVRPQQAAGPAAGPSGTAAGAGDGGQEGAVRPVALRHDIAIGPTFEPYVAYFNEQYDIELTTAYAPTDYFGTTVAQLAGGSVDYDVMLTSVTDVQAWYRNGWTRALDDFPGVDEILAEIPEEILAEHRAPDGTLIALPYYRGNELFCSNARHLEEAGLAYPETWDDFVTACQGLRSAGVVDTPYSPFWTSEATLLWYSFTAELFSDGAPAPFDGALRPTFTTDPATVRTLERWRTLYADGLVPADVFTTSIGDTVNVFGGGRSSFTMRYGAQLVGWADPEQSSAAPDVRNGLIPGSTHETINWGAMWTMAAASPVPDDAWELMRYLSWQDTAGEYHVPKRCIAIDLGLLTPYEEVNEDPEVRAAWSQWADVDTLLEQLQRSRSRGSIETQVWYADFLDTFQPILQDVIRGDREIDSGLDEVADFVAEQA